MKSDLTRRQFVAASGAGLMGTLAFSAGPVALLAPSRSWALPLSRLDTHTGETLLRVTRRIYPHESLENAVYALVVKALDEDASGNPETATLLIAGVAELDAAAGAGGFLGSSAPEQRKAVERRAGTEFFEKVRSTAVVALYNNELAFAHFGYEGPAFDQGGYLTRGFNDLDWLPDPPASASPAV